MPTIPDREPEPRQPPPPPPPPPEDDGARPEPPPNTTGIAARARFKLTLEDDDNRDYHGFGWAIIHGQGQWVAVIDDDDPTEAWTSYPVRSVRWLSWEPVARAEPRDPTERRRW